ncbi:HoxN/HupN/NixA family nickel/cobalt transporter, partial [Streptomyces sp. NPDC004976]
MGIERASGVGITAYTFGMQHAFDTDDIAAIDSTTRKLGNRRNAAPPGDGMPERGQRAGRPPRIHRARALMGSQSGNGDLREPGRHRSGLLHKVQNA